MKLVLIMLISLTLASPALAVTKEDMLHVAAHAGAGYAVTHATQVVCKKLMGKDHKFSCTVIAAVVSTTANVAYKGGEGFPSDTPRALISGAAGTAFAITLISIDW